MGLPHCAAAVESSCFPQPLPFFPPVPHRRHLACQRVLSGPFVVPISNKPTLTLQAGQAESLTMRTTLALVCAWAAPVATETKSLTACRFACIAMAVSRGTMDGKERDGGMILVGAIAGLTNRAGPGAGRPSTTFAQARQDGAPEGRRI